MMRSHSLSSGEIEIMSSSIKAAASSFLAALVTMASRKFIHGIVLICAAVFLMSSCGGSSSTGSTGGQGAGQASVSFSTNAISFKTPAPFAQAPATQTITGTVTGLTSGTVYITVQVNSPNDLFTVTNLTFAGNSAQLSVIPAAPSFGVGNYSGSITVSTCLNDPTCNTGQLTGSPRTIPVNYDIASGVDGSTVTPRVVPANAAGEVILRGTGFTAATNVSFGSVPASSISVLSDSEIDASYPALAASTYPITINSGGISHTASLSAVAPPAFSATSIPFPSGDVLIGPDPPGIEYDAGRTALFILLPGGNSTSPTLVRYAFDGNTGTWGTPTQISMAGLEQVHLSPDGTHLLGMVTPDSAHTSMVELDPVTMAQTKVTTASNPPLAATLCGFAIANDGNAIVGLGGLVPVGGPGGFAFGTSSRIFTPMSAASCNPVASGNGAIVALNYGTYVSSTETVTQQQGPQTDSETTTDFLGNTFLSFAQVENQTGQVLGFIGSSSGQVVNAAGTRAYGIITDPNLGVPTLATFDLTATPSGSPDPKFPQLGTPMTLATACTPGSCRGGSYALATTPDGSTIFMAGPNGLIVQPLP